MEFLIWKTCIKKKELLDSTPLDHICIMEQMNLLLCINAQITSYIDKLSTVYLIAQTLT